MDVQEEENLSNERTLLLVEKNILLNHELEGAVEEYLGKKISPENKIIQISSIDEGGRQAIRRLIEAMQNVCMHGWVKKRFVESHPRSIPSRPAATATAAASSREEGGRQIATSISKMYSKMLLNTKSPGDKKDNTYEEFLNKSPVLWLWLSHTMAHCRGSGGAAPRASSLPGPGPADNSITEKLNISQHCICLNCSNVNCYVHSMEIFLEHHGSFFVNKEITLDSFFECILFCALQTGKLLDILEMTSLIMACEGAYSSVDQVVEASRGVYCYSPGNVRAVRALAAHNLCVVPADQFAPEALLRAPSESSRALSTFLPLRDHYLHFCKAPAASSFSSSSTSTDERSGSRSRDTHSDQPPPSSPSKEKKRPNVFKSMSLKTISAATSAATSLLDDISSLTSTSRVIETEPPRPRHLMFSTNMDIIQVSNIKFETAQEKWYRKIGEGALCGSELQRKAEIAFILRILLRDRPPLEFLESRNILKQQKVAVLSHYSSYNIEILKYEKLSIPSSTQQVVVYYIDVYQRCPSRPCPVHLSPGQEKESENEKAKGNTGRVRVYPHKCTCKKWTIRRRYTDFDELHKHLKNHIDSDFFSAFKLPQKAYVQVVQSSFFYAKRLMGLREYLRSLLTGLPDMAEVSGAALICNNIWI
jgi:hypothetical protein